MKKMMRKVLAAMLLAALLMSGTCAMAETADADEQIEQINVTAKEFKGTAKVKLVNKGKLFYGDKITLKAVVKVNGAYSIQWQVKEGGQWKDIENETGKTYSFTVTPENQDTQYRVMVCEA